MGEDDEIRLVAGYLEADVNSSNPLAYSFSGERVKSPVSRASRAAYTPTYERAHTVTYESCTEMVHLITPTNTHYNMQALQHTNTLTHTHGLTL